MLAHAHAPWKVPLTPPARSCRFVCAVNTKDMHEVRQSLCSWAVDTMHKYTPVFTNLIGSQYLQRIAVMLADVAETVKPRTYFAANDYRAEMTPPEDVLIGQVIYLLGCSLFSWETFFVV